MDFSEVTLDTSFIDTASSPDLHSTYGQAAISAAGEGAKAALSAYSYLMDKSLV